MKAPTRTGINCKGSSRGISDCLSLQVKNRVRDVSTSLDMKRDWIMQETPSPPKPTPPGPTQTPPTPTPTPPPEPLPPNPPKPPIGRKGKSICEPRQSRLTRH